MGPCFGHSDEPSGYVTSRDFSDLLRNYYNGSAPCDFLVAYIILPSDSFIVQQTCSLYSAVSVCTVKHLAYLAISSCDKSKKGLVFRQNKVCETNPQDFGEPNTELLAMFVTVPYKHVQIELPVKEQCSESVCVCGL